MKPEMDEDPTTAAKRQGPLRFLYAFLLVLPLIALAVITSLITASTHRARLERELKEYGRQKTLELRDLGKRIYRDFLNPQIGGSSTDQYYMSEKGREVREELLKFKEANRQIRAIAIFASSTVANCVRI